MKPTNETKTKLTSEAGATNPLTDYELAQLKAALVLIRRGDIDLAEKVLTCNGTNAGLARELQVYIAANSPNVRVSDMRD